ncbi:hypothetical protein SLEP1_g57066 [Rubroshorea leprosula]|uniref:Leucine-rich repeat-containing N-terminal plant-type domain-containing protein n=1 Tax=Rubroshorea leprosula TaxID=152421 RepID=A0AAV5MNC7_9ROSI|nr:hypothetical protein SLEP1_g57066 [Rubroshorea leprosula]
MGRLIRFSQILCLSFMLLQFRVQSSSPFQSSLDSSPHLCRPEERSALLDFKSTTNLVDNWFCTPRPIIQTWNESKDCCSWEGIACDKRNGHVIGLDLSSNCLEANLTTNSSLFRLEKLQSLNLSDNYFHYPNISFGFNRWKSLTYLNLSGSGYMYGSLLFDEIFLLSKLVSLDLSFNDGLFLDNIKFQMLVHNLTELRFLILDSVNMSLVVPSSLLNLFSSLEHLSLSNCSLQGNFPSQVFQLPSLQLLDLSSNSHLGGELPHSIGNLKLLKELNLRGCQFYGSIPRSLANLTKITQLDFSSNHFRGQIPDAFGKMHKLDYLNLYANNFGGEIPASIFNLTDLSSLSLSSNMLIGPLPHNISGLSFLNEFLMDNNFITGCIPSWLFSLPSLSYLDLQNNKLTGPIDHVEMPNLFLEEVYLLNNEISGSIPSSFFDLVNLIGVDISSNNLTGTITPDVLSKLVNLEDLDLSNNSLLSLSNNGTAVNYSFPNLQCLMFSSCNIQKFPSFLRRAESLRELDISKNKISGQIHKWEIEGLSLDTLNLSYNFLTGIDSFGFGNLRTVDLRSNLLQGSLPFLSTTGDYMDQLLISGNNLTGEIPSSYCNFTYLEVLVLANNRLGGKIPECFGNLSYLNFLDLRMNKFHGRIPNSFVNNCVLLTLSLNGNQLEGILPRSLVNCSNLEILDVGNNNLNDTFPHWLGVLQSLKVLILRSNRFHGAISNSTPAFYFPQLRIIDVAQNDFMGLLPSNFFKILKGMRDVAPVDKVELEYIGCRLGCYRGSALCLMFLDGCMDSVKVVMKGNEVELERILKIFTTIDFSSNQFHGPIPDELGQLNSLLLLNLSHNSLNGQIPSSLGKLVELESLDLSSNKLEGKIPEQLTKLTFLSVLNLSHNELMGHIPEGKQFSTFSNDSYIGNSGLCGLPLTKKCEEPRPPSPQFDEKDDSTAVFEWKFALAGYGCGLVLGLSLGYIAFTIGKPWCEDYYLGGLGEGRSQPLWSPKAHTLAIAKLKSYSLAGGLIHRQHPKRETQPQITSSRKVSVVMVEVITCFDGFDIQITAEMGKTHLVIEWCIVYHNQFTWLYIAALRHLGYNDSSCMFLEMLINRGCLGVVPLTLNQKRMTTHYCRRRKFFSLLLADGFYGSAPNGLKALVVVQLRKMLLMLGGQVNVTSYYCAVTIEDDVVIIAFRFHGQIPEELVELSSLLVLNFPSNSLTG